jgi:hypothetical protein
VEQRDLGVKVFGDCRGGICGVGGTCRKIDRQQNLGDGEHIDHALSVDPISSPFAMEQLFRRFGVRWNAPQRFFSRQTQERSVWSSSLMPTSGHPHEEVIDIPPRM